MVEKAKPEDVVIQSVQDRNRAAKLLAKCIAEEMAEQGTEPQIEEALQVLMDQGKIYGYVVDGMVRVRY